MVNNYPGVAAFNQRHGLNVNITATSQQANAQINQLQSKIAGFTRSVNNSFSRAGQGLSSFDLHLRRINANVVATGFALVGLTRQVSDFVDRGAKMEMFTARMVGVSGTMQAAEKDMAKITTLASKTPFSLEAITKSFIKLKVSGIEPITGKNGDGPLASLLDALSAFGGDSEILDRVTNSLTQMAGKGVVSMEELRQQLGEAMPTALRIAAREMGMSVKKFTAEVAKGQITWDDFANTFFEGVKKNYGGTSIRLMNTFTAAMAKNDDQWNLIAKTIFVDTGAMRYFTAAVQIANEKMAQFGEFMKTPAGEAWIDSIWQSFKQLVIYASRAVAPVKDVLEAIGSLAGIAADFTGSLPAEIVGGGIIGYVLFGRAGLSLGALAGAFSGELKSASASLEKFVSDAKASLKFDGVLASAAAGGLIGLLLLGPQGALAGAAAGALASVYAEWDKHIYQFYRDAAVLQAELRNPIDALMGNRTDIEAEVAETMRQVDAMLAKRKPVDIKVDMPTLDPSTADEFEKTANDLMGGLEDRAAKVGEAMKNLGSTTSEVIGSLSKETYDNLSKVKVDYTDFEDSIFPNAEVAKEKLTAYEKTIQEQIASTQDKLSELYTELGSKGKNRQLSGLGLNDVEDAELKAQIARYEEQLQKLVRIGKETGEGLYTATMSEGGSGPKKMVDDLIALNAEIQNFTKNADISFDSNDQMVAKAVEWGETLSGIQKKIAESTALSPDQKEQMLAAVQEVYSAINTAQQSMLEKSTDANAPLEENVRKIQGIKESIDQLNGKSQELILGESMTGEAERVREAGGSITQIMNDIQQKILEIQAMQKDGLISAETANTAIANLNAIAANVESNKGRIMNAATDIERAWQTMGREIYSAIESSIGDAIYGLVTKTKSMKDVLVDLWKSITRAVSNYIAKLIMAGLFGGSSGGGGGGLLGGLFGANTGAQLSFAGGGNFMVDGRTGFDNNVVGMRVSRGERVTVETAAQQRANNRSGNGGDIHIHAVDGESVRRLFMREGAALQQSIQHRARLNNQ